MFNAVFFGTIGIIWGVLIVATIVIELATEELDCVWFTAGAIVALILLLCGVQSILIQVIAFVVVSCTLLFTVGRWANRMMKNKNHPTNIDAAIGKEVIVTKDADYLNYGEGKYNGLSWTITCKEGTKVQVGDIATILEVVGNKLIVEKKINKEE